MDATLSPKEKRKILDFKRRRRDILEALERLGERNQFNSFDKLNLEDIAAEAGLTKPTLYRYFSSKDDLLTGFAAYSYRKLTNFMKEQLELHYQDDVANRLNAVSIAYFHFASTNHGIFQILNLYGKQNRYLIIKQKLIQDKNSVSQSELEYFQAWEEFRNAIAQAFDENELALSEISASILKQEISSNDFVEILALLINGIITELGNRNRVLQERGYTEENILNIIMFLIGKGLHHLHK
ncbi:MAG: TetR/AcrR family transcriptional regulator [Candidatus Lokiarchaeota archaeon]|nr:TetR/AcrR family transcriptional regulator [Candidatus Harpocratesius repetitus]